MLSPTSVAGSQQALIEGRGHKRPKVSGWPGGCLAYIVSLYSEPYVGVHAAVGMTPKNGEGGLSAQRTLKGSQVSIPNIRKMRQRSRRMVLNRLRLLYWNIEEP